MEPSRQKKFIAGIANEKFRQKAYRQLLLLEEFGSSLREPESKPVRDGIFELRITFGRSTARVLYFFYLNNTIVLTNGFLKKTGKTPRSEIDKALRYKKDFEQREGQSHERTAR